jgi:hypothetical protein
MAITDQPKHQTAASQQQQQTQQQNQTGATGQEEVVGRAHRLTRNVGRNRTGDSVGVIAEALNKQLKETGASQASYTHRVLPVDASAIATHYGFVVVLAEMTVGQKQYVSIAALMAAGSNKNPAPVTFQANHNQKFERILVPGDGWDKQTFDKLKEFVAKQTPTGAILISAGCIVIPEHFNSEDLPSVHSLLWAGTEATAGALELMLPDIFPKFSVKTHIRPGHQIIADWSEDYSGTTIDEVGRPVRADFALRVSAVPNNTAASVSGFQHDSPEEIISVFGYPELVYAPPQQNQQLLPGQVPVTQQFRPRLIITKATAPVLTLESLALAITNFFLIGDNYAWAGRFRRATSKRDNIGVLGYLLAKPEAPTEPMGKIDTGAAFTDNVFASLMTSVVHAAPTYSMDCDDAGPDSWLTYFLVAAAVENSTKMQNVPANLDAVCDGPANMALIRAFDTALGGGFAAAWGTRPMVQLDHNRIFRGAYTDPETGAVRDRRDIDSMYVLTEAGAGNMDLFYDYAACFDNINTPVDVRMDTLNRLIRQLAPKNLTTEGYAERINFNPLLPGAAIGALQSANYAMKINGLNPLYAMNAQRGNVHLATQGATGIGANRLYQATNQGGGQFNTARTVQRW